MGTFTQLQMDALQEVGSISAGNSATAFSQMVSKKINMTVPQVSISSIHDLKGMFQDNEVKIGLYQRILGQAGGSILMVFSRESAFDLVDLINPASKGKPKILKSSDEDILKELANIVAGAYLTTLSKMTGLFLMPSVPHFTVDLTHLMIEYLLQTGASGSYALVVRTELKVEGSTVAFQLILLPDPEHLSLILSSVGAIG